jgi:hypothetical protein
MIFNEGENMSGVVVCFKILYQHLPGGTKEYYEYFRIAANLA